MKFRVSTALLAATLLAALAGTSVRLLAHHEPLAKFDDGKTQTISGVISDVDWKNPHVHVFVNVKKGNDAENWAIELEDILSLTRSGWNEDTVHPGDHVTVTGWAARNGSRQIWSRSFKLTKTGKEVFAVTEAKPPAILTKRPTPRWPDNTPKLGAPSAAAQGYWAYPSKTVLMEDGQNIEASKWGLLKNINDAPKMAPMQNWALALYKERQKRFLADDPMYLNCKPPGGPRQFQLSEGVQFVEDRERQRIFVLFGGGNTNYRIIYLDGRKPNTGQVGGDDDNPLYYGRAVAKWQGDTLVSDTEGFNEDFWFTNGGLPHTEQLKLTERFTRPDLDTLNYDVTIDDPGAYTRTWKASWTLRWVADQELPRQLCQDNRP
ncbi:MAG TPA: DUF6152 family protein [Vicinamibacterales bacterium]|jgi:hypothetical protein|nr:DUF6152 family protein [Vicinamibacterales bacterium]